MKCPWLTLKLQPYRSAPRTMKPSFIAVVTEIGLARYAWSSSDELRAHFGGDIDVFLRYRIAAIRPPADEAINPHPAALNPSNTLRVAGHYRRY